MKSTNPSENRKGRTKKTGIFSERERDCLQGKISFTQKQRWAFLNLSLRRIEACTTDIQLFWETEDNSIKKWQYDYWNKLYTLGQKIIPRHYSKLKHYRPGHIKSKLTKIKGRKRGTRVYWLDESDKTHADYNDLPWPNHLVRKTKPISVKQKFMKALMLEEKFWYRKSPPDPKDLKKEIIPRSKENALNIKKIQKRIEYVERKLTEK